MAILRWPCPHRSDIDENATEHRLILGIKDNKNNNNT